MAAWWSARFEFLPSPGIRGTTCEITMIYGIRGLETWGIYKGILVIEWGYKAGVSGMCIFLSFCARPIV